MAVFLQENGVLAMGNKTPVSILQEMLHKRKITPHYELLYNGATDPVPLFKYRVSGDGLSAIGEGKSKKAAKHDAAATYLKRMTGSRGRALVENSNVQVEEEMNVISPYTGAIKENYVGKLDEVCVVNRFPLPLFEAIKEEGPPHARIFTMKCSVSSIKEIAAARTKKQAKHLVAQQMINRLEYIMGDKFIPPSDSSLPDMKEDVQTAPAIEFKRYQEDMSVPLADVHNAFFHRVDDLPVPEDLSALSSQPEEYYRQLEKPKAFLDSLLEKTGGSCKITPITKDEISEALSHINDLFEKSPINDDREEVEVSSLAEELDYDSFTFDLEDFDCRSSSPLPPASSNLKEPPDIGVSDLVGDLEACGLDQACCEPNLSSASAPKKCMILLTLDYTQGQWVFPGIGKTVEQATNEGSRKALIFLRKITESSTKKK